MNNDRIKYLEKKLPKKIDIETKYRNRFEKSARYLGNGIYQWNGAMSTDTQELFLLGVLNAEQIKYKEI